MVCSVSLFLPPPLIYYRGESGVLSREMHRLSPGTDFYIKWRAATWKMKPRQSFPCLAYLYGRLTGGPGHWPRFLS